MRYLIVVFSLAWLVTVVGCGTVKQVQTVTHTVEQHVKVKDYSLPKDNPRTLPAGVKQLSRYDFIVDKDAKITRSLCPDKKGHDVGGNESGHGVASFNTTQDKTHYYITCFDPAGFLPPAPNGVMTRAQFDAIQIGESLEVLRKFYPSIDQDQNDSGDTAFLSPDGKTAFNIVWKCQDKCANETVKDKHSYAKESQ